MGRPRQPWCPDCKAAGRYTEKAPGQSYCRDCLSGRQRASRGATYPKPEIPTDGVDKYWEFLHKQYLEARSKRSKVAKRFEVYGTICEVFQEANLPEPEFQVFLDKTTSWHKEADELYGEFD